MSDIGVRVAVAVFAVGAALAVAGWARGSERRAAASAPLDLSGYSGRLILFSDVGCRRCDQARAVLIDAGVSFEEAAYDREPDRVRSAGVTAVPLLVGRDADGAEVGRVAGRLGTRALQRLMSRMG